MRDCLHAMAPNDEELLKHALDDERLPREMKEHIEHCVRCQQRLSIYKRTNAMLLAKLYRSTCPDATQLNYYCAQMLPVDARIDIARHLEICPLCATEVVEIRRVLADYEPFPTEQAFSTPARILERIVATLVPWQPQLVTRGEVPCAQDASWPRQYCAGPMNISLHLSRASNGEIMLLGLFSSTDPAENVEYLEGMPVELYSERDDQQEYESAANPIMSTIIDDLGNVVFKAVSVGVYTMVVHTPDNELVLKGLNIQAH